VVLSRAGRTNRLRKNRLVAGFMKFTGLSARK
jgi:hypothetical protein